MDRTTSRSSRKAQPGGRVKWINLPRNWAHQALSYTDRGELVLRILLEAMEFFLIVWLLSSLGWGLSWWVVVVLAFLLVHTWNWVTNGLFWAIVIFAFPGMKNPGASRTVEYLHDMTDRLKEVHGISGLAVYGSVSRGKWHERSDIDVRLLRRPGLWGLLSSFLATTRERFLAFLARQPMDLYLADDTDFLSKMRSDEIPLMLIKRDPRLDAMYPDRQEESLTLAHLVRPSDAPPMNWEQGSA